MSNVDKPKTKPRLRKTFHQTVKEAQQGTAPPAVPAPEKPKKK